ncbi:MAG: hypothetical protein HYR52_06830 [Candidatus Tectomicrobia bacterium]|nr:hypothetical protein [Candidatus Tectomicrobia bacterium]
MAGRGPDQGKRKLRPGKIRGSAAEPLVRACLLRGGTLEEASGIVADNTGYFPNKSVMSRYWRSVREEAEREWKARALAGAVAERAGRGEAVPLARRMLQAQLLEAAAALPDLALGSVSAERLSLVICRLARAGR